MIFSLPLVLFSSSFVTNCCQICFAFANYSFFHLCIVFSSSHSWRLPDTTPCPLRPLLQGPHLLRLLRGDALGSRPAGAEMWRLDVNTHKHLVEFSGTLRCHCQDFEVTDWKNFLFPTVSTHTHTHTHTTYLTSTMHLGDIQAHKKNVAL